MDIMRDSSFLFPFLFLFLFCCGGVEGQHLACDNRRPEGHVPIKKEGDGGFRIVVEGPGNETQSYTPNQVYNVTIQGIQSRYQTQKFMEFLLVAESEKQPMLGPTGLITTGIFHILDDRETRFSDLCPDGVTSINRKPKSRVSVLWTAPSILVASCITFKATVVERPHRWYMDDGRLTHTLCPQSSKPSTTTTTPTPPTPTLSAKILQTSETLTTNTGRPIIAWPSPSITTTLPPPPASFKCCACDDAKYDVTFEGFWSKESHPKDFPEYEWLLHFSDLIGASHSSNLTVWAEGMIASEGIKQVGEWGSTRALEEELRRAFPHVNTIIKARGLWHPNEKGTTTASFKVDRDRPLISLVSMLGPSPDWIVGVSSLQLCRIDCSWIPEVEVDLYPWDAGTDSGITYMSPNTPLSPQKPISRLNSTYPNDPASPFFGINNLPPFARLQIRRQRIYPRSCDEDERASSSPQLLEVSVVENTDEDINRMECGVTEWTQWSECSVRCGKGLRMRKRSYLLPQKADMFRCDRQLVEKEMCLAPIPTCPPEDDEPPIPEGICEVTPWSQWSPCSVTCGESGYRTKSRRYKNHMGRKKCSQQLEERESCKGPVDCGPAVITSIDSSPLDTLSCPVSPWSLWSPCSVTCGRGFRTRSRILLLEDPSQSELPPICGSIPLTESQQCVGEYGEECKLSREDTMSLCKERPDPGPCRATQQRFYFDLDAGACLTFNYGGCKGNKNRFVRREQCWDTCGFIVEEPRHLTSNPTTEPPTTTTTSEPYTPLKTYFFSWTLPSSSSPEKSLSSYSSGFSTSDTVQQVQQEQFSFARPEEKDEIENNVLDLGASTSAKPGIILNLVDDLVVDPPPTPDNPRIDCVVSQWSEWSSCNVSCGVGTKVKTRKILMEPQNEGRRCPRKLVKRKQCTQPPCPSP